MKVRPLVALLALLLTGCLPPFAPRLAHLPDSEWHPRDARAFLLDSPFAHQAHATWQLAPMRPATLHGLATWVSPLVRQKREALQRRFGQAWPVYANALESAAVGGAAVVRPDGWRLLGANPADPERVARWATSPASALAATRALSLAPVPGGDFASDLGEAWGLGDQYQVDVEMWLDAKAEPPACLSAFVGQMAARGVRLQADGQSLPPTRAVVLGLGQSRAAWGPLFVRLWFPRQGADSPFLPAAARRLSLRVEPPADATEVCPLRAAPLVIPFDPAAMRATRWGP